MSAAFITAIVFAGLYSFTIPRRLPFYYKICAWATAILYLVVAWMLNSFWWTIPSLFILGWGITPMLTALLRKVFNLE